MLNGRGNTREHALLPSIIYYNYFVYKMFLNQNQGTFMYYYIITTIR